MPVKGDNIRDDDDELVHELTLELGRVADVVSKLDPPFLSVVATPTPARVSLAVLA